MAWLGLALCAQAAHATYAKITIVKINQGGDQNDQFTFDTNLNPAPSPTSFAIKAGEASRKTFQVECNATTECTNRWGASTQTITERSTPGYTLTALDCRHTGGDPGDHAFHAEPTQSSLADGDTTANVATRKVDFKLNWGEWVKCWVTNTRDTGTIKVTKKLVPATDSGKFNLLIDGVAKATDVGDGGTTGTQTVSLGAHTVGEAAGTGTSLADYDSSTSCVDKAHGGTTSGPTVNVAKGDQWECVVTNTRKTGTIKVTKKVVAPAGDTGKFNLLIDGAAKATNVGDGGTTGTQTVNLGAHTVGESAGTGTSLADYDSSTSCVDKAHGGTTSGPTVNVAKGDQWECVITNTRKTATIKVTKALSPATDSGKFNLLIAGQALATDVGDGGTTGVQTVLPGTYAVGESAGTGTDLANYTATISCTDTAHPGAPADTDGSVQVAAGDAWECLITNTRKSSPPPNDQPPSPAPKPGIAVSPARVKPGSAKLRGPSGCPTTAAVAATVSGRQIAKVTFYVDGKKVKTLTRANKSGGRWVLPMNVKRFAFGTHRVRATVQFTKASQTKSKTYALSFSRCHPAVVKPKFTG